MSLEGTLETSVSGDAVTFTFTVTNTGPDAVELQFADAAEADVAVTDEGREVWRYTEGRMFAQVVSEKRLAADEAETYEFEWSDPESGEYAAVAELRTRGRTCEARTEFTV